LYQDELRLLSNVDGSPITKETITYETTYLFNWEEGKQYKCQAKEIPGKEMFSRFSLNSLATGYRVGLRSLPHYHIPNHQSVFDYKYELINKLKQYLEDYVVLEMPKTFSSKEKRYSYFNHS